jgi:Coiled-coil domain-containing protein 56
MAERTPAEIRQSVEETRKELEFSLNDLQSKVNEMTNWRRQLVQHRRELIIGAAVAGFVVGGGVAAVFGLFKR